MGKALVTGPSLDPVSLAEAKAHCEVAIADDDGRIAGYILAARQLAETNLRRALITQTWDLLIDYDWPRAKGGRHRIEVPLAPLQSVTSITYVDTSGVPQTLAADQYVVSTKRHEGIIEPAYGVTWPTVRNQIDAVTVRFVAGYGSNPGDVPEPIRHGMLMLIKHWYDNGATVVTGTIATELPFTTEALWFPYRVFY